MKFFSTYLGFSGSTDLSGHLYNKWNGKRLTYPENYILPNIDVVHVDFKVLLDKFKDVSNVFYIFDPPYLFTDKTTYNKDKIQNFWTLSDSVYMLDFIFDNVDKCILFESDKSGLINILEFANRYTGTSKHNKRFEIKEIIEVGFTHINTSVGKSWNSKNEKEAGYKDHCVMLVRNK